MGLMKCGYNYLDETAAFYGRVVNHLEKTVNYPKWTKNYPNRESVEASICRMEKWHSITDESLDEMNRSREVLKLQ